jgi:two-component system chemotaxis response regulator CheB
MKISRDIVVVGVLEGDDSECIRKLIFELPADFPASILIAFQIPAEVMKLERIPIAKATLPLVHAREGQKVRRGCIYLGTPYANLVTRPWGVLGLEPAMANDHRHLSIQRFFDSAAQVWGNRVIGVLLNSKDAAQAGSLASIDTMGGITVIEDRKNHFLSSLSGEIHQDEAHRLLPSSDITHLLAGLIAMPGLNLSSNFSFKTRNRKIYGC